MWEFLDFEMHAFHPNMLNLAETTNFEVTFHARNHLVQFN